MSFYSIDTENVQSSFLVRQGKQILESKTKLNDFVVKLIQQYALEIEIYYTESDSTVYGEGAKFYIAQSHGINVGYVSWMTLPHPSQPVFNIVKAYRSNWVYIHSIETNPYDKYGIGKILLNYVKKWASNNQYQNRVGFYALRKAQVWWYLQGFRCCDMNTQENDCEADAKIKAVIEKKQNDSSLLDVISMRWPK